MTAKAVAEAALDQSISGFVDNLNMALTTVSHKLASAAPEAAHLLLKAVQLHAVIDVATGLIALAVGGFCLAKIVPKFIKLAHQCPKYDSMEVVGTVSAVAAALIGLFALIGGLNSVLSTENLMAIFSPEAAIALKAISAAGIKF